MGRQKRDSVELPLSSVSGLESVPFTEDAARYLDGKLAPRLRVTGPGEFRIVYDLAPRYTRAHGEQPEPQTQSSIGACKWCERVPCEDMVHGLWRQSKNGQDV